MLMAKGPRDTALPLTSPPPLSTRVQDALDAQLAAVFGTADLNTGKTLSLTEFLGCLHLHQLQQIRSRPTMKSKGSGMASSPAAAAIAAK